MGDEPRVEEEGEEKDHGGLLHNYCPTAYDNERRLAAELARDSLCALVPCKEMARGSGALGSCTEEARDSVVALWSAALNSRVGAFRKSNRLDTTTAWTRKYETCFGKHGKRGVIQYSIYAPLNLIIPYTLLCVAIISHIFTWPVPVSFVCIPL